MANRAILGVLALVVCGSALGPFPLDNVVSQALSYVSQLPPPIPTGITKRDYLELIFGTVQAFIPFQNMNASSPRYGKIIDPYDGNEIQYSTPCFANAAALLIKEGYCNASFTECWCLCERLRF